MRNLSYFNEWTSRQFELKFDGLILEINGFRIFNFFSFFKFEVKGIWSCV